MAGLVRPIAAVIASVTVDTTSPISDQITIDEANVFVRGADVPLSNGVYISHINSGHGYVCSYGTVDPLEHSFIFDTVSDIKVSVSNLNELMFSASFAGKHFCWIKG